MSRSLKKGPFVDEYLIKKVEALNASGKKDKLRDMLEIHEDIYNLVKKELKLK